MEGYEHQESFIENHNEKIDKLEGFLEANLKSFWDFIQSDEAYKSAFSDMTHDYALKHSVSDLIESSEVQP